MSEFGRSLEPKDLGHPNGLEIIQGLLVTGDGFTSDFERLKAHLDRIAPVRAWFKILSTPPGFAPGEIREQWVGLNLPLRCPIGEGVAVIAREALEELKPKSPHAHDWWVKYYAQESAKRASRVDVSAFPEFSSNINYMFFADYCGESRMEE